MEPVRLVALLGGVARIDMLRRHGVDLGDLRDAVTRQRLMRPVRGIYALPTAPEERLHAVVASGVVGCVSACESWGLPLVDAPSSTHLVVPHGTSYRGTPARLLALDRIHRHPDRPVDGGMERPAAAVDQAAWCTSPLQQLAILDAAMRLRLVNRSAVEALRHGPRRRREWLAHHSDPSSASLPESFARIGLRMAGLAVRTQVEVPGVGRVDFLLENSLIVEVDGYAHHSGKVPFDNDRRRDRAALRLGLATMRFTYWDCTASLDQVVSSVCDAVGRRPDARLAPRLRWAQAMPGS